MNNNKTHQNFIIKSYTENNVAISGYASVYEITDQHNDLIAKGAFAEANNKNVKFLWQHDRQKPIGVIQSLLEDNYGLKVDAIINNKIESGREAIELIRQGAVDSFSVGFNIKLSNYNKLGQRIITKAELIEISIVTFPANNHAKIYHIYNENNKEKTMDLEHTIKKMNNINENFNNFLESEKKSSLKISMLEGKIDNMMNFLSRPDISTLTEETEYKTAFNNYIRKGREGDLLQKALGNGAEDGGILLLPTLYSKVMSGINAISQMRQLASVETISTNVLDIVIEDGKFSCGWIGDSEARDVTDTPKLQQKNLYP